MDATNIITCDLSALLLIPWYLTGHVLIESVCKVPLTACVLTAVIM